MGHVKKRYESGNFSSLSYQNKGCEQPKRGVHSEDALFFSCKITYITIVIGGINHFEMAGSWHCFTHKKNGDDPRKNWMGSEACCTHMGPQESAGKMVFVEAKTTMFGLHVDFESVRKNKP